MMIEKYMKVIGRIENLELKNNDVEQFMILIHEEYNIYSCEKHIIQKENMTVHKKNI